MFDSVELVFYQQIFLNLKKFKRLKRSGRPINGSTLLLTSADLSNALYQNREHFQSVQAFSRSDVEALCPAFEIVGDVANAFKHGNLKGATPHGKPHVQSASDIQELDVLIGFLDENGPYWHSEKCISVETTAFPGLILDNLLIEVFNFWRSELEKAGKHSFPAFKRFPQIGSKFIPRSRARLGGSVAVQGLPFQSRAQITLFDPERMVAVPFPSATNIERFCQNHVEIRIRFADDSENPITLGTYEPTDKLSVDSFLERIKGGGVDLLEEVLTSCGIDLWGLVRDRFGTSANGRAAAFEVQKMTSLTAPSGSVSVIRRPGSRT